MNNRRFSFGLRGLLLLVALCAFALAAWNLLARWPSVTISGADIKGEKSLSVRTARTGNYCTSLAVRIYGNLNARTTMVDPWGNAHAVGPGEFDFELSNEYYDEQATFRFSSKTATAGSVTVQYNASGI